MDFVIPSPLSYGKVDEQAEKAYKRKTLKRLIIIAVSWILLLVVIICVVTGTVAHKRRGGSQPSSKDSRASTLGKICNVTRFPDSCRWSLSSISLGSENVNSADPKFFFNHSLRVAIEEHSKLSGYPSQLLSSTDDENIKSALRACEELFEDALEYLNDTIKYFDEFGKRDKDLISSRVEDIRTKLSTVLVDQDTCLDSFVEIREINATAYDENSKLIKNLRASMQNSTEFVSNSLAIVTRILGPVAELEDVYHPRRLLGSEETKLGFPVWVGTSGRRLLLSQNPRPNMTVAKDGTGDFKTINKAVAAVPEKSKSRFVIYIKQGFYMENVLLGSSKWNVMIYGDGNTKTIVSGIRNRVDNPTLQTFKTATFSVEGRGFIAKDIGFKNTAGPEKHQAVAFRSKSDYSVMYRCAFDGYQDTLYAHANRQFYRECDLAGTVDFICGHAAAVFQNCTIRPRLPLPHQFNTVTAQAKDDPAQKSGFAIIKSTILPYDGDSLTAVTYLGRPWKNFSTTVIMETHIGQCVSPLGWIAWNATIGPPHSLFYGEYNNTGPRSSLSNRVKWVGYRPKMTENEAHKFTVEGFLNGKEWLPGTGIPFDRSL